jgi:uncharacterized membrane protein
MYKIIGADGKEYGPITTEQLRQWVAEGRANAQTKVLPEGATEWKSLAEFPELIAAATITPRPQPAYQAGLVSAADQVNGPAIGLIVTACLGFFVQLVALLLNVLGVSIGAMQSGRRDAWVNMFSGTIGIVSGIITMLIAALILLGAIKMKKLEAYGWAITASILALVPCISPCCLVGLPIGIWALVVLSKPEVKSAFH